VETVAFEIILKRQIEVGLITKSTKIP